MSFKVFLEYKFLEIGSYSLTSYKLIMLAVILAAVRLLAWFLKKALESKWKSERLDPGGQYAIVQIGRYILWIIAIALILETLGVKVTILLAGSAALLVGIGLGLQQTFNDIISGIILLIEGNTKIGDVLEVENEVVKVREIGLRTSKVISRDDIMIIIPNSQIVTNKVINWTHQVKETRFRIKVGVAYGSDVDLVIKLLQDSAMEHDLTSKTRNPEARFSDFGSSSLDFEVLFWCRDAFRIGLVMSDIRRNIDRKFRANMITIPFPQRDLHLKSSDLSLIEK